VLHVNLLLLSLVIPLPNVAMIRRLFIVSALLVVPLWSHASDNSRTCDCDSQLATRSRALHASVFDLYQSLDSHSYWWIDSNYQLSEASTALLQRCFELFPDSWEIFQHTYQLLGSCKHCDVPNYYNLSGLLLLFHRHILGKHVAAEAYYTKFLRLGMGGTWYEAEDVWALQAYLQQLVGEGLRLAVDVLSKEAGENTAFFWRFLYDTPSPTYNKRFHQSLHHFLGKSDLGRRAGMKWSYDNLYCKLTRKLKRDFSNLWTAKLLDFGAEGMRIRPESIGYIGADFQRFYIHITRVWRDEVDYAVYHVRGKLKLGDRVCLFAGKMRIDCIEEFGKDCGHTFATIRDRDNINIAYQYEGYLRSSYSFKVFRSSKPLGVLRGDLTSYFLIDSREQVQYNNLKLVDSYQHSHPLRPYCNNQFKGVWLPEGSKDPIVCNWGDYRIPDSKDLDIGTEMFSPDDAFLDKGWQTYRDAFCNSKRGVAKAKALAIEKEQWWE
jgi:hypothetical protein